MPRRRPALPILTWGFAAACTAVFAHMYAGGPPPSGAAFLERLIDHGAKSPALVLDLGQRFRLLTSHFTHTSVSHLAFNLAFFLPVGSALEQVVGLRRFAAILAACSLASNLASLVHTSGVSAGASGVVFGVLGAAVSLGWVHGRRLHPRLRVHFGLYPLPFALLALAAGLFDPRIDTASHLAGFGSGLAAGIVTVPRLRFCRRSPAPARAHLRPFAAVALGGLGAAAILLAAGPRRAPAHLPVPGGGRVHLPAGFAPGFSPLGTYEARAAGGLISVGTDAAPVGPDLASWYLANRIAPLAHPAQAAAAEVQTAGDHLAVRYLRDGVWMRRTVTIVARGARRSLVVVETPDRWNEAHRETRRIVLGSFEAAPARSPYESPRAAGTLR